MLFERGILMKKVWISKRKNRSGYYVGWYDEHGKRHSKAIPNKALAEKYRQRLEIMMNQEVYQTTVGTSWETALSEYLNFSKNVKRSTPETIRSITHTLKTFESLQGPVRSDKLSTRIIEDYFAKRNPTVSPATANKDIRNLRTFHNFLRKRYYNNQDIDWPKQKEPKKDVVSLTPEQVFTLLSACYEVVLMNNNKQSSNDSWFLRILLAVTSGLRKEDIEHLTFDDIDLDAKTCRTFSQKTQKSRNRYELHPVAVEALRRRQQVSDTLFDDKFTSGKWKRIRIKAGLPPMKFHDLRSVFASFVAIAGYSTSVVQELLEHSTPLLTQKVYINVNSMHRKAVESIPITQEVLPALKSNAATQ